MRTWCAALIVVLVLVGCGSEFPAPAQASPPERCLDRLRAAARECPVHSFATCDNANATTEEPHCECDAGWVASSGEACVLDDSQAAPIVDTPIEDATPRTPAYCEGPLSCFVGTFVDSRYLDQYPRCRVFDDEMAAAEECHVPTGCLEGTEWCSSMQTELHRCLGDIDAQSGFNGGALSGATDAMKGDVSRRYALNCGS